MPCSATPVHTIHVSLSCTCGIQFTCNAKRNSRVHNLCFPSWSLVCFPRRAFRWLCARHFWGSTTCTETTRFIATSKVLRVSSYTANYFMLRCCPSWLEVHFFTVLDGIRTEASGEHAKESNKEKQKRKERSKKRQEREDKTKRSNKREERNKE